MDFKSESTTVPVLPPPEKQGGDRRTTATRGGSPDTAGTEEAGGGSGGGGSGGGRRMRGEGRGNGGGGVGGVNSDGSGGTRSPAPAGSQHGRGGLLSRGDSNPRPGLKGMSSVEGVGAGGRRRSSKDDTPPSTPPPRPPPPKRPPSIEEMREKEKILQRMTSMPAYSRSDSIGYSRGSRASASGDPRHLSMNGGRNLSLDQPGYSPSGGSGGGGGGGDFVNRPLGQSQTDGVETTSKRMEGVSLRGGGGGRGGEGGAAQPNQNSAKVRSPAESAREGRGGGGGGAGDRPKSDSSAAAATKRGAPGGGDTPKNRTGSAPPPAKNDQADTPPATGGGGGGGGGGDTAEVQLRSQQETTRAPKFTTTKRRSSTVDEMLFDDYVEPEDNKNAESVFSPENLPQDLMSFDVSPSHKKSPGGGGGGGAEEPQSPVSVDSSDAEYGEAAVPRSASQMSDRSWSSNYSLDSQPDDLTVECMEFMKAFVDKIFKADEETSQVEKAKFGELCQHAPGRVWFARYVNSQRVNNKRVTEETFFRLVQYLAVCLFECHEAEDFSPAKTLMNMCFTFYCDMPSPTGEDKSLLYMFLKEQPIWQSLRFWNAAFFDAVQCERSRRPTATNSAANDTMTDDRNFQENITFGQLGTFSCNMRAFGLSRELCLEFLRKQSTIANLSSEQVKLLRDNVNKMKE